ncbi:MAG: hypothetical protein IJO70_07460 [Lachnospiraceae bacterium]|nr:hypothetical protein [Lachnospiraceae bacterium]
MTREELVSEYNYYIRKKSEYTAKLNANSVLKGEIESRFDTCIINSEEMNGYCDCSNLFDELSSDYTDKFSETKKQEMIDMLNALDTYLNNQIMIAQYCIYYWDEKIKAYDEQ